MNLNVMRETLAEAKGCNGPAAVELFFHIAEAQAIVVAIHEVLRPKIEDHVLELDDDSKAKMAERFEECRLAFPEPSPFREPPE